MDSGQPWFPKIHTKEVRRRLSSLNIATPSSSPCNMNWQSLEPKHIINDNVYGTVKVPRPIDKLIDTVEFQRLRHLKQTGLVYLVYPNCEHSRFVHSLGTFSLAYALVDKLRHSQPSLNITESDLICTSVAALLHDVGHGPFSHLFDGEFAKRNGSRFKHEDMSILIIKKIMNKPEIKSEFACILGETDEEYAKSVTLITELISGKPFDFQDMDGFKDLPADVREETVKNEWAIIGCGPEKSFLFDVVSNSYNGHDVDKMDYLLRDSKASGVGITFSESTLERLFNHVRVVIDPNSGLKRIAYSIKCIGDLKAIGDSRQELHSKVYQHKAVRFMETLMVDALINAGDFLKYKGSNGELYSLKNVTEDVDAFLKTTDYVEQEILNSQITDPKMIEAQTALLKIQRREIGCKLGYFEMNPENATQLKGNCNNQTGAAEVVKKVGQKMKEILEQMDDTEEMDGKLKDIQFTVMHSVLGRGLDDKTHPIERQIFYDGKPSEHEGKQVVGFYPSEDYVINNCPRMATKWEIFVMGDRSLRKEPLLADRVKRALQLAGESEKFLTPRKRSPQDSPDEVSSSCSTAKRRLEFGSS
ncbi:Deoxynucleoside triphosphate triphosphohydrolase sahd-1 [Caenorhabditis elegans]|uniref:Deoxynucleoside triphosphate triphosphohydrolase sahd-1 n=3 Tax=Caenorhabditis elegans TaxID=6239 RepID=SAMH1_CAEEL|nr:SAMHD1 homolog [Caenorhabditis elegans]Q09374.2 RecName: Full=Deoxynucleoside triphosphate triphosphohydrolase sahd-1; Short=dNTPase; AltName: Full=SAM domain and HD domain-containing protein 1; AltName: Full=SAMHD1 homolog [Caenorhabditis elegans]CCD64860.1 SAMHD1 homolog [Caenorhabditis elegans]|eukprot:NP_495054.1 Uncharacterized protein CELE_ZK177.8 [Caenorhabditis elegans]